MQPGGVENQEAPIGTWRSRGLSKWVISRVISTLIGVTLIITLFVTDLVSSLGLQVSRKLDTENGKEKRPRSTSSCTHK